MKLIPLTKGQFAKGRKKFILMMSRAVMCVTDSKIKVDHINHDTLDNQKSNLRAVTHQQNHWWPARGKWVFRVSKSGKRISGYRDTKEEAISAHAEAARKLHGEFAYGAAA